MAYSLERLKSRLHKKRTGINRDFHIIKNDPYELNDKQNKEKWQKVFEEVEAAVASKKKEQEFPKDLVFGRVHENHKACLRQLLDSDCSNLFVLRNSDDLSIDTTLSLPCSSNEQFYKGGVLKHDEKNSKKKKSSIKLDHSFEPRLPEGLQSSNDEKRLSPSLPFDSFLKEISTAVEIKPPELLPEDEREDEEDDDNPWDLIVNVDFSSFKSRKKPKMDTLNSSLLRKFMRLPESQAPFRKKTQLVTAADLSDLPLSTRVQIIENTVAANFVNWFRSLGGIETGINEKVLKEFFQIGMVNPASHSFKNTVKEFGSLPRKLAEANSVMEEAVMKVLKRHILWNAAIQKKPIKTVAFDKNLPSRLRFIPPDKTLTEDWLKTSTISKNMEILSLAFSGILHVQSLYHFCSWLKNRGYDLPQYLKGHRKFAGVWEKFHQETGYKILIPQKAQGGAGSVFGKTDGEKDNEGDESEQTSAHESVSVESSQHAVRTSFAGAQMYAEKSGSLD